MSFFCYTHNWSSPTYECPSCNKERVRTYSSSATVDCSLIGITGSALKKMKDKITTLEAEIEVLRARDAVMKEALGQLCCGNYSSPDYCVACDALERIKEIKL